MPLSYRDIKKSERDSMVCDILDRFNIVGKKDLYPNQLSGGQQQLVAVARAVIANPKVILADEPTGNLHSSQGREIMELFKKLNDGGTTIVQVTHSETNAGYGSRVIELKDGWVVGVVLPRPPWLGARGVAAALARWSRQRAGLPACARRPRQFPIAGQVLAVHADRQRAHDQARRHRRAHAGHDDDVSGGAGRRCWTGRDAGELVTGTLEVDRRGRAG